MFDETKTKDLIKNIDQLQAWVDAIPLATKEPAWFGEKPHRSFGHAAIVADKRLVGLSGKDYQLVQHHEALDPLIATLKDQRFVARPFTSAGGKVGLVVQLPDVSHTFPGQSRPTIATMRVGNAITPGASLSIKFGIYKLICGNGMHVGAMKGIEISHIGKMSEKIGEYQKAVAYAPRVIEVYGQFLRDIPEYSMTVEQVTEWLVGAGFPVRDVISAINETASHLFGEQQDVFGKVGWNPKTLLEVATHIVSNPPNKKDGEVRTLSVDTQWNKLALVERSIKNRASIEAAVAKGRKVILEAEEESAVREKLLPLIRV